MAWTERYVDAAAAGGGNGTTSATSGGNGAWTFAEGLLNASAGHRVNMKAGTYANTTTSRNPTNAGTTTAPIWWRGYKTTIGDMDTQPSALRTAGTDIPSITFTTGQMTIGVSHHIWSNINITGAATAGAQLTISATNTRLDRVRCENTGANSASSALQISANFAIITRCWFKATSTASKVVGDNASTMLWGVVVRGGGDAYNKTAANLFASNIIFLSNGANGLNSATSGSITIFGATIYGAATDGIHITTLPNGMLLVNHCITNSAAWGLNNTTGANTNIIQRCCGSYYSNASGNENGFGNSPTFNDVAETASPFVNPNTDMSLLQTSLARANGLGLLENESFASYLDIGAIQRKENDFVINKIINTYLLGEEF